MRNTRSILPGLLALSLAVALPATVTAQDTPAEAADVTDVTYATGRSTGEPARFVPPTEESMIDGVGVMRGQQVIGAPQEFTDPRLSGLLSMTANGTGQEFEDGWAHIESRTYRIENDDGAWTGSGISAFAIGSDEPLFDKDAMLLTGEGAYDGLIAYVFAESVDDEIVLQAVILESEAPPVPQPVDATAVTSVPVFTGTADLDAFLGEIVEDANGGVIAQITRRRRTSTSTRRGRCQRRSHRLRHGIPRGQLAKTFISTDGAAELVDEGLVDLDAPLSTSRPTTPVPPRRHDPPVALASQRGADYTNQSSSSWAPYEDPDRHLHHRRTARYDRRRPGEGAGCGVRRTPARN